MTRSDIMSVRDAFNVVNEDREEECYWLEEGWWIE